MPKFIAKQSLGHFRPGDEIKGLEDKQLQALLASGAIAEDVEAKQVQYEDSNLNVLKAEITDLKAKNKTLEDEKVISAKEITDLKAKVADLEKSIATEKKPTAKPAAEK
ncbi:hypothetical protein EXU29_12330 [Acinetobacter wuhouensis]|uniref:hypothetical protein n=1 Tax=Acinetobacter wuhouensis TaxID=1879050 RepID=UPI0010239837|nr:hypothetical protein [Acinetobacter wuhouensis]RZG71905.1 hypothetical protein EXU29_12330 [Acinetobacter wuhouensis]